MTLINLYHVHQSLPRFQHVQLHAMACVHVLTFWNKICPMWRVQSTSQDSASQMTKQKLTVNVFFFKTVRLGDCCLPYRLEQMYLGCLNVLCRDELQAVVS